MNNRCDKFINKILSYIERYELLRKGDSVLVCLSGGADSVSLLRVLCSLREKYALTLYAAHVNHMLRGDDAFRDEEFAKELCVKNNIEFFMHRADVNKLAAERKQSTELAARNVRYDFFFKLKKDLGIDKIATAHNKNDQAETSLMHYIRGSGIDGLRGIAPVRDDGVIRPLLCVWREEIEEYLDALNQSYVTDSTNFETVYTRNKVRHSLIPYLKENFNPGIEEVIARNASYLYEDALYLQHLSDEAKRAVISKKDGNSVILLDEYKKYPKAISFRVLKSVVKDIFGENADIDGEALERLDNFCCFAKNGKTTELCGGIYAAMEYGEVRFYEKNYPTDFCYELRLGKPCYVKEAGVWFSAELTDEYKKDKKYEMYFDYNLIKGKIYIRNRLDGDKFSPFNMKGTKKLKDFFIDEKIPLQKRDKICLITDETDILWVAPLRRSDKCTVSNTTKKILKIQMQGEYKCI